MIICNQELNHFISLAEIMELLVYDISELLKRIEE